MPRPTGFITLVTRDGKSVRCTIKTPLIKLTREFRKQYMLNGLKNTERSSVLDSVIAQTGEVGKASDQDKAAARATLNASITRAEELDTQAIDALIESVKLIINVPNDTATTDPNGGVAVGIDAIDFESCDLAELNEACNFFLKSYS
jgi:hypothetical protein